MRRSKARLARQASYRRCPGSASDIGDGSTDPHSRRSHERFRGLQVGRKLPVSPRALTDWVRPVPAVRRFPWPAICRTASLRNLPDDLDVLFGLGCHWLSDSDTSAMLSVPDNYSDVGPARGPCQRECLYRPASGYGAHGVRFSGRGRLFQSSNQPLRGKLQDAHWASAGQPPPSCAAKAGQRAIRLPARITSLPVPGAAG